MYIMSPAGTVAVRTSVLKDDHTFTVHVIDPKDGQTEDGDGDCDSARSSGAEKAEFEKPEKDNKDGEAAWIISLFPPYTKWISYRFGLCQVSFVKTLFSLLFTQKLYLIH